MDNKPVTTEQLEAEAMRLNKQHWEMVPDMENFINKDGHHQVRLHFADFTVDLIETDQEAPGQSNDSIIEVA